MHLLSPTHHSKYADPFPSIKNIRRSLSRSPSKPSRFQVYNTKSPKQSPVSPRSPSSLSRTYSAETGPDSSNAKPRFMVRRSAPLKAVPRRTSPNSPMRRALSDGLNQSNTTNIALPFRNSSAGQENVTSTPTEAAKTMRFELDNEPIKFDLLKAHGDKPSSLGAAMRDHLTPAKSSPLKRSDGVMNLDQPNLGSPRAKRRSLHGAAFGSDFNIFEHGFDADGDNWDGEKVAAPDFMTGLSSPRPQRSPQRRPFSLRKSTLRQRSGSNSSTSRPSFDLPESPASLASPSLPSPGLARTRSRISLDGVLPLRSFDPVVSQPAVTTKPAASAPKPHPLSKALSPSSSASSLVEETLAPPKSQRVGQRPHIGFSKSLPIGALRPRLDISDDAFDGSFDSFETPEAYKMARPLPMAFMSTGLISKRNRNIDTVPASFGSSVNMPDTPSKRTFLPMGADTPARPSLFGSIAQPKHEFGSPTTPFSPHVLKGSPESFGKGVSIFGSKVKGRLNRRSSFLSIDGDCDDVSNSPTADKMDTQVAADELPPTPTKPAHTGPRPQSKGKGNSLRSSLLGRRSSLAPDTFIAPDGADQQRNDGKHLSLDLTPKHRQRTEIAAASRPPFITFTPSDNALSPTFGRSRIPRLSSRARSPSPLSSRSPLPLSIFTSSSSGDSAEVVMQTVSAPTFSREGSVDIPVTPSESFTPPDASRLSISGNEPSRNAFANSVHGLPPATPTGPRDHPFNFSISNSLGGSSIPQNDVDTTLTARFGSAQVYGIGEFSIVYRVENPLPDGPAASLKMPTSFGKVWAVKKSKKPYAGSKDRARKMKEVQILKGLKGHEHIIEAVDTWEMKNHLYIQTEFCENGNLKDFLTQAGFKARIDDFRIWKILLELSLVSTLHVYPLRVTLIMYRALRAFTRLGTSTSI